MYIREECFQSAKGILRQLSAHQGHLMRFAQEGLDHCEARSWHGWHGWHRRMTLSMLALAFLAGLRARLKEAQIEIASAKANK